MMEPERCLLEEELRHFPPNPIGPPLTVVDVVHKLKLADGRISLKTQGDAKAFLRLQTFCFREYGEVSLQAFNRLREKLATRKKCGIGSLNCMTFVDFVTAVLESCQQQATQPDGPDLVLSRFWWQGKLFEMEPIPSKLLRLMWGKEEIELEDDTLNAAVWGHEPSDNAVKSAIKKVNAVLTQAGYRRTLGIRTGWLYWSP